jgi:hypothetical protein
VGRPEFTKDKRILGIGKAPLGSTMTDVLVLVSSAFEVLE